MTNLGDFTSSGGRPVAAFTTSSAPQRVEPLGGTADVEKLMDAFPEEVYQRGRDSRLYRFISTLCGDAGAGQIKKQSYVARLRSEGEHLVFENTDKAYTSMFGMRRLPNEKYDEGVSDDALGEEEWQTINAKDNAFTQRMQDFFSSVRWGGSPMGIALAARGGAGVDCEIIESYKAILSEKSDDPLGLELDHPSINHFRILPYVTDRTGNLDTDVGYSAPMNRELDVTLGTPNTATQVWTTGQNFHYLKPEIERNLLHLVDRLRPVGASMSVTTEVRRLLPHAAFNTSASSQRFMPVRFVTGRENVQWPPVSPQKGHFIQAGIENEAPRLPGAMHERPSIFFSILGIQSYTNEALDDPDFNTAAFWDDSFAVAPAANYRSVHGGLFDPILSSIYPAVKQVSDQQFLEETLSLAQPFSPLRLSARGNS